MCILCSQECLLWRSSVPLFAREHPLCGKSQKGVGILGDLSHVRLLLSLGIIISNARCDGYNI